MSILPLLFVDNERIAREQAQAFFKREGLNIDVAPSAEVAKEMIDSSYYKVVVTDLQMPIIDGMELAIWIDKNYPQIDIVFATNHTGLTGFMDKAKRLKGYRGYVEKPLTPTRLITRLNLKDKDIPVESCMLLKFR